jgi:predicted kinase
MRIVIFDIDGTLADISHRLHHIKNGNRNWAAFNSNVSNDTPIPQLHRLLRTLHQQGYRILLVSGRGEEIRQPTINWLENHNLDIYSRLYMRPVGDYRRDTIIKQEILQQIHADFPTDSIEFVVDDRSSVVDMWRSSGLVCLQCAHWEENDTTFKVATKGLLTLLVGPSGAGKSTWASTPQSYGDFNILQTQIISSDGLRYELTGNFQDQSKNAQVFAAIHAMAKARIDHGLATIIDATNIRRADRLSIISYTQPQQIRYIVIDRPLPEKYATAGWRDPALLGFDLIAKHHSTFTSQLKDILAGDHLPNVTVHDLRTTSHKITGNKGAMPL